MATIPRYNGVIMTPIEELESRIRIADQFGLIFVNMNLENAKELLAICQATMPNACNLHSGTASIAK